MKSFNENGIKKAEFRELGDEALHGDVILTAIKMPKGFEIMPTVKDGCLAYGEATGHKHQIFGDEKAFSLKECPKTKVKYLRIVQPVTLKHQEHSPIVLPPGDFKIGIQREYDPFEKLIRRVAD